MEGEKNSGEGSSRRKRQAEWWSSRRQTEAPPVEEEVDIAEMEVEEEVEDPTVNVEEEQKKRAKAMKSGEMRARVSWIVELAVYLAWDVEATAFVFPWGHMIPSLEDVSRITGLRIYGRPVSGYTYPCYHDLAERLLELPVERRLLFATRGDAVHCRFLPLLEDLSEVGGYAWGAAFLAHQFDSLGASEWSGPIYNSQPWGEGISHGRALYPLHAVVWQPYLGEGDEGQPWLVQARPYFDRSVWLHALNLVLPLHLFLCQRSLGLRQSVVEFPVRDRYRRPGRSFRGLHDTTDWRERTKEQIDNWEHRGKAIKSDATSDDAYLQAYALKYGGKVYKSARHQVDVAGEIASLRALLYSTVQNREAAQRELERVRSIGAGGASSSRAAGGSPSLLEAQLAGAVLRAEEAQRHLEERVRERFTAYHGACHGSSGREDQLQGEVQTTRSERDQLRIRAEAAEAQVAEVTKELATLRVLRSPGDQEEVTRLRAELLAQQAVARTLQQIVTDIGRSRSRSRSGASVSRATGASVGQYLAGSSSQRRNEEEERHRQGEGSAQSGRGGGEMPPPPDRQEGSGESGGGQSSSLNKRLTAEVRSSDSGSSASASGSLNSKLTAEIKSSRSSASVSVSAFFFLPGYIRWNICLLHKARLWWRGEGGVSRTEGLASNGAGVGDSRTLVDEGIMGDKMGESQSGEVMAATVGVKEGVEEVAEQVGGLELQDVVAWGFGLCQGHLSAVAATVVVVVAGTVAGRARTIVVVVVVAAIVAFAVAVVASDPVGPLRLLRVWRPTYRALGIANYTDLLIGLDPLSNWALRLLDITGFWGLKHGVY
ncbi:hypothetical protein Taro_029223, partial [Colocasia esculenta]|nr:hypothetical protein [Colocasia esculenta]